MWKLKRSVVVVGTLFVSQFFFLTEKEKKNFSIYYNPFNSLFSFSTGWQQKFQLFFFFSPHRHSPLCRHSEYNLRRVSARVSVAGETERERAESRREISHHIKIHSSRAAAENMETSSSLSWSTAITRTSSTDRAHTKYLHSGRRERETMKTTTRKLRQSGGRRGRREQAEKIMNIPSELLWCGGNGESERGEEEANRTNEKMLSFFELKRIHVII